MIVGLLDRHDNERWDYWLMLAVWTVPFATVPLGIAGLPASSIPWVAFGARLLWRMHKDAVMRPSTADITDAQRVRIAQLPGDIAPAAAHTPSLATFRRKIEGLVPWARIARGG